MTDKLCGWAFLIMAIFLICTGIKDERVLVFLVLSLVFFQVYEIKELIKSELSKGKP